MSPLATSPTEQLKTVEQQPTPEAAANLSPEQRLKHAQESIASLSSEQQAMSQRFEALTAKDAELGGNEDAEEREASTEAQLVRESLRKLEERLKALTSEVAELKANGATEALDTIVAESNKETGNQEHEAQAKQLYSSFLEYMTSKYGADKAAESMTSEEIAFGEKLKRSRTSAMYNLEGLQKELDDKKGTELFASLDAATANLNTENVEASPLDNIISEKQQIISQAEALSKAVLDSSAIYQSISDDEAAHFDDAAKKKEEARQVWADSHQKFLDLFHTTDAQAAEKSLAALKLDLSNAQKQKSLEGPAPAKFAAKKISAFEAPKTQSEPEPIKQKKDKPDSAPKINTPADIAPPSLNQLMQNAEVIKQKQLADEKAAAELAAKQEKARAEQQKALDADTEYRAFVDGEYNLGTVKGLIDTGKTYSFKDVVNGRYADDAKFIMNNREKEIEEKLKEYSEMPTFTDPSKKSEWLADKSMLEKMHIDAIQANFNFQEKVLPEYIAKIQAQKKAIEDKYLTTPELVPEKPASPPPLPIDFRKNWPTTPDGKSTTELINDITNEPVTDVEIPVEYDIKEPTSDVIELSAEDLVQEPEPVSPLAATQEIPQMALAATQEIPVVPTAEVIIPIEDAEPVEAAGTLAELTPDAQFTIQQRLDSYAREIKNAEEYLAASITRSFDGTPGGQLDVDYAQKNLAHKKAQHAYNSFVENLLVQNRLVDEKGNRKKEASQYHATGETLKQINALNKVMQDSVKALDVAIRARKQLNIQQNLQAQVDATANTQAFNMGPLGAKSIPFQAGPVDPSRSKEFQMTPPSNQSRIESAATVAIESPVQQKNSPAN